jgi:hypothetical protein
MKRKLSLITLFLLAGIFLATPSFAGWTITASTVDRFNDSLGEHAVIRITVTIDGSSGSFTTGDVVASVRENLKGYMYWVGIDGVDTGIAPQLTITDKWNFTRFVGTTFHATNPITVRGDAYNGQYPQIFDGSTFTFTDSGNNEQYFYLYLDMVR